MFVAATLRIIVKEPALGGRLMGNTSRPFSIGPGVGTACLLVLVLANRVEAQQGVPVQVQAAKNTIQAVQSTTQVVDEALRKILSNSVYPHQTAQNAGLATHNAEMAAQNALSAASTGRNFVQAAKNAAQAAKNTEKAVQNAYQAVKNAKSNKTVMEAWEKASLMAQNAALTAENAVLAAQNVTLSTVCPEPYLPDCCPRCGTPKDVHQVLCLPPWVMPWQKVVLVQSPLPLPPVPSSQVVSGCSPGSYSVSSPSPQR